VVRSFAHDAIIYDPTESVSRAQAVVTFACELRAAFGRELRSIHLDPDSLTLFLALRRDAVLRQGTLDATTRQTIEAKAKDVYETWRRTEPAAFDLAIRLCLELPPWPLGPVDKGSLDKATHRLPWLASLHSGMVVGGLATLLGSAFGGSALAQSQQAIDLPAVSQINGKISAEGGGGAGHPLGEGIGSITAPVGHSFGVQLDGGVGSSNGNMVWGVAGQGFWRDPNIGLLGVFSTHMHLDLSLPGENGVQLTRTGVEGEYYFAQFTPSVQIGDQTSGAHRGAFGVLNLSWYPLDNLELKGGADLNPGRDLALLSGEYQLGLSSLPGLSVFAESGISGSRDNYALVGFRYYFGPDKTLIRRHREDDPPALVINQILGATFANIRPAATTCAPSGGH